MNTKTDAIDCYLAWDDIRDVEQQYWIQECLIDVCDGSSSWIPGGHVTDPEFDYGVLEIVRQRFTAGERKLFGRKLHQRMSPRVEDGEIKAIGYRAGDYAACVYAVAMELGWCQGIAR